MMMHLLTGLAVWMAASVALGLMFGRAMHGYAVSLVPARAPLRETEEKPPYERAA